MLAAFRRPLPKDICRNRSIKRALSPVSIPEICAEMHVGHLPNPLGNISNSLLDPEVGLLRELVSAMRVVRRDRTY
uniref:Uncharacterized protein n=1 Tax=Setaria digitata TaxID=48799 RepID=A0A915Q1G5_9BILA